MTYEKVRPGGWRDRPYLSTALNPSALDHFEEGIYEASVAAENALPNTPDGRTELAASPELSAAFVQTTSLVGMGYFKTGQECMFLAMSSDAWDSSAAPTFTGLSADPVYVAPAGTIRDPAISPGRMPDGYFYVVFTFIPQVGDNYNKPTGPQIGFRRSRDLISWENAGSGAINVGVPALTNCWAPKWFIDNDGSVHVIFSGTTSSGGPGPFNFYEIHPQDPANLSGAWSAGVAFTGDFPGDRLDAFIVRQDDGTYVCVYKNRNVHYLEIATATALTGPYTVRRSGNWSGWGNQEGPTLKRLSNGKWRLFFDWPSNEPNNYRWADSLTSDLATTGWTGPLGTYGVVTGNTVLRHGTQFAMTGGDAQRAKVALDQASAARSLIADDRIEPGMLSKATTPPSTWTDVTVLAVLTISQISALKQDVMVLGAGGNGLGLYAGGSGRENKLSMWFEHKSATPRSFAIADQALGTHVIALRLRNAALDPFVDGVRVSTALSAINKDTYATRSTTGSAGWTTLKTGDPVAPYTVGRVELFWRGLSDTEIATRTKQLLTQQPTITSAVDIPLAEFTPRDGAPDRIATGAGYGTPRIRFDKALKETVIGTATIPADWSTFRVRVLGCNEDVGTGTVIFALTVRGLAAPDGGTSSEGTALSDKTYALVAAGQYQAQTVAVSPVLIAPASREVQVRIQRSNSDYPADNLANDYDIYKVRLERVA